ncbi:MAG: hypothetical protein M5R36_15045 [Deltaproteobacteria bacterium]|nr:hypothetical protein [Deltaproteobacteria bacterium]
MNFQREFPLSRPEWKNKNVLSGFRTGFSRPDGMYMMSYTCDLIRMTPALQPEEQLEFPSVMCNSMKYAPQFQSAYLTGFPFLLHRVDVDGFKKANSKWMLLSMWVEPIPGRDEIAVNGYRSIVILDATSLETRRVIRAKTGIRSLAVDQKRNLIYVAQYFRGELAAYDLDTGEAKGAVFVGPLLRAVNFSEKNDRIYTGSSQGIYEIDPNIFEEMNTI